MRIDSVPPAMLDEYDLVTRPQSRALIVLDDDDDDFLDEWEPSFHAEDECEQDEWIALGEPIIPDRPYSEVVRSFAAVPS